MSYSEFYQRSITQPESFWAEQAQRIDWQQPYTQVLDHSNRRLPAGFAAARPICAITPSTAGWRNSLTRWR